MFVNGSGQNVHLYRKPSIDASYQVSVHLVKQFQRRRFLEIDQSETRIVCSSHICKWIGTKWAIFERTSHRCILPSFGSFGKAISEEKIFLKSTNQKKKLSVTAMFVNGSGRNEQSQQRTFHRWFLLNFGSFGQTISEENILRNRPIRNNNCLRWPCLLTDWEQMNILYRGPSIDASYQVSVHLAKWFQRRRFIKNQPIRNKNCM